MTLTPPHSEDSLMDIKMESYDDWLTPSPSQMSPRPSLTRSSYSSDTQFSSSPQPTTPLTQDPSTQSQFWLVDPPDQFAAMLPLQPQDEDDKAFAPIHYSPEHWSQADQLQPGCTTTFWSGLMTPYGLDTDMDSLNRPQPIGLSSEPEIFDPYQQLQSPFQSPQIVAPSELSPDFPCASAYTTHDVSSFDCSSPAYDAFDHDYAYDIIKEESSAQSSPVPEQQQQQEQQLPRTPPRIRKRSSKRHQKPNYPRYTFDNFNTEIIVEGESFRTSEGYMRVQSTTARKPHCCKFKDDNGDRCTARFERSEHLKRHKGNPLTHY